VPPAPAGLQALLSGEPPAGASLRTLDLSSNALGSSGCGALAAAFATLGRQLTRLVLAFNAALGDADVAGLAAAMQLPRDAGAGVELDLSGVTLGAAAPAALGAVPGLRSLNLLGGRLQGGAAQALAAALQLPGSFPALMDLNVAACQLRLEDLQLLLGAVSGSGRGADAAAAAVASPPAPALQVLVIGANPAADQDGFEEAVDACRERRPGLDIHWRGGPDGAGAQG
jgi:hypothetical protein